VRRSSLGARITGSPETCEGRRKYTSEGIGEPLVYREKEGIYCVQPSYMCAGGCICRWSIETSSTNEGRSEPLVVEKNLS